MSDTKNTPIPKTVQFANKVGEGAKPRGTEAKATNKQVGEGRKVRGTEAKASPNTNMGRVPYPNRKQIRQRFSPMVAKKFYQLSEEERKEINKTAIFYNCGKRVELAPRVEPQNFYDVLSTVETSDEPMSHDEICLDQKTISRASKAQKRKAMTFDKAIAPYQHSGYGGARPKPMALGHDYTQPSCRTNIANPNRKFRPRIRKSVEPRGVKFVLPPVVEKEEVSEARDDVEDMETNAFELNLPFGIHLRIGEPEPKIVETPVPWDEEPGFRAMTPYDEEKDVWLERLRALEVPSGGFDSPIFLFKQFMKNFTFPDHSMCTFILDLLASLHGLTMAKDFSEALSQLYTATRLLCGSCSMSILKKLWSFFSGMSTQADEEKATGWRNVSNVLNSMWQGTMDWVNCPSVELLLDIINVLSFLGIVKDSAIDILSMPGYSDFTKRVKKEITGLPDIVSVLMRTLMMVTDCVANYYENGVIDFMGWSHGAKKEMFISYSHLMTEATDAINRRLDDPGRAATTRFKSQESYLTTLASVIDGATCAITRAKPNEKAMYAKVLKDTLQIQADMTSFVRCSTSRVKPYTFVVCGVTSSMKSTVSQAVWRQIAAANNIDSAATNFCTVNFKDEYFSEVRAQEVLILDDFMNEKATMLSKTNPIRVLLDWSSNVSTQMPAAHLEEKGKRYCNAKILGITCHSKVFHAETMSYQPEAAYRRVEIYIETHLRPQYRTREGQPDFGLIPDSFFPDVWDFHLYRCVTNGTSWTHERIGGPEKIFNNQELMQWLIDDSRIHFERQRKLVERNNSTEWICPHNMVVDACQVCSQISPTRTAITRPVTREACEDILAKILRGTNRDARIRLLESVWDLVARHRNQEEVDTFLSELGVLYRQNPDEIPGWLYEKEAGMDADAHEAGIVVPADEEHGEEILDDDPDEDPEMNVNADEYISQYHADPSPQEETRDDFMRYPITAVRVSHSEYSFQVQRDCTRPDSQRYFEFFQEQVYEAMSYEPVAEVRAEFSMWPNGCIARVTVVSDPDSVMQTQATERGIFDFYADPSFRANYPLAPSPYEFVKEKCEMLDSGTFTGWLNGWLTDRVVAQKRTNWVLTAALTTFNLVAIGKNALLTYFGCWGAVKAVAWATARCAIGQVTIRGVASILTDECLRMAGDVHNILNVGHTVERWSNRFATPQQRRDLHVAQLSSCLPEAIWHRIMYRFIEQEPPSLMKLVLGPLHAPAKAVMTASAYAAALAGMWYMWQNFVHLKPALVAGPYVKLWKQVVQTRNDPAPDNECESCGYNFDQLQTNSAEPGYIEPLPGEEPSCWVKVAPPEYHLGEASKTTTPGDLENIIKRNLGWASLNYMRDGSIRQVDFNALSIGGNDWLIPTHTLHADAEDFHIEIVHTDGLAPNSVGTFCRNNIVSVGDTDFSIVRLKGGMLKKKIYDFFPLTEANGVFAHLMLFEDRVLVKTDKRRMPVPVEENIKHGDFPYKRMRVVKQQQYPVICKTGLCGAVWIGNPQSKPFIHSLHICGNDGQRTGGSAIILRGAIDEALLVLNSKSALSPVSAEEVDLHSLGLMEVEGCGYDVEVHEKHPLHFVSKNEQLPIADVIGMHSGHSGKYAQNIVPSLIADHLTERLGWTQDYKPVPRPNAVCHYNKGFDEIMYPRNGFRATLLERAHADLEQHIMAYIDQIPDLDKQVKPLVDVVNVSGQDGIVAVEKINPTTSAGFPEKGAKGRFFVDGDQDDLVSCPKLYDEFHMSKVDQMEEKLAEGKRIYAPFTLSVKIEPTKVHKEHARLFGGSNMCFTFLFRKYYLSIFRLIQLNPYRFECALGINCHSRDWDEMSKMLKWDDRLVEGDYQTYDKTMSATVILNAFEILIKIAAKAGYTERQLRIMSGIAHEVAYPMYEARGVLFVAGGSNPSGHPGTFVINCLANSLFMRYAFYWSLVQNGKDPQGYVFYDYVRLVTAGDDHLASVSPECDWFDQIVVQKALETVRMGYTDGKKNPIITEKFIHKNEASFVCRGFRYCELLKRVVAPLALKSLKKSYMIHNFPKKPVFGPEEQIAIVVEQNLAELFFYGKEKFDVLDGAVRASMVDAGLGSYNPPQITWEELGFQLHERTSPAFIVDMSVERPQSTFADASTVLKRSTQQLEITDAALVEVSERAVDVRTKTHQAEMSVQATDELTLTTMNNNANGMMGSANIVHDTGGAISQSSSRGAVRDGSREMYMSSVDSLSSYLERPVLIAQLDWGISTTPFETYRLLTQIMGSVPISNKLQNFVNISFEIELSIEVSANPFLYGMLLVNWVPYPKYDGLLRDRGIFYQDNVEASQRQRLFIDASTSTGGTMTIPFYWPANYFNMIKDNPDDFGYLSVRQLNPLMHVSGASQTVTVYFRAKMKNVQMHTSTVQPFGQFPSMSLQADESPTDNLSSAATRVASVAAALTPVFGGYAMATSKAAGAAAGVLRAMGLAHPRSKEMYHRLENRPLGNVSNFNTPSNAITLGIDEHNEVTIDPMIVSLTEDEMSFKYILEKEAFIGTYDWSITDAEGDVLAYHRVHPMQFMYSATGTEYHTAPIAYLSRLFEFWTGSIIFRFQIVVSKWHRGRLRFIHDPVLAAGVLGTMWQTNLQTVVDIAEEREFEIEVSYAQAQSWLQGLTLDQTIPSFYTKADALAYGPDALKEANGVLLVAVMNRLVIPDDTVVAPAHINVFVRAGKDYKLAVPRVVINDFAVTNLTSPPPAGVTQSLAPSQLGMIVTDLGNTVFETNGPALPVFNKDSPVITMPFLGTTSRPIVMQVEKVSGTGTTIQLHGPAGNSNTATYDGTGKATVTVPMPSGTGYTTVPLTVTMDNNALVKVISATVPVREGQVWESAYQATPTPAIRVDGSNDLQPSVTYPLTMLRGGGPSIIYRVGGPTNLYEFANNGAPVFITYKGDIKVINGVYSPTLATFDDAATIVTAYYTPPSTGYGSTRVNIGWQGYGVPDPSIYATGEVYNVIFLKGAAMGTEAMETQAEEMDEGGVADPDTAPRQASLHDTMIQAQDPMIYMGEQVMHVRQILGRIVYINSIAVPRSGIGYNRTQITRTNIPPYPQLQGPATPYLFLSSCYNGWHGTTRTKYVINAPFDAPPSFAKLYRNTTGLAIEAFDSGTVDLTVPTGVTSYVNQNNSLWGGAVITNPALANELNAEFPYYYRFRFRSSRAADPTVSPTTTDSHTLWIDSYNSDNPIIVDRYFQPGEDFTLFNWMGTPILYPSV